MAEKTTKGKGKKNKQKGQKKQPSETPPKESPSTKKKANYECGYCGKIVSNAHNLKVHEHHCRSKSEDKEKKEANREIESAVRKLQDEFEDQRDKFQKEASDREDLLRQELEELKDILRLEIRRTHHDKNHDEQHDQPPEDEHEKGSEIPQQKKVHDPHVHLAPGIVIPEKPEMVRDEEKVEITEKIIEPPISEPVPVIPDSTPTAIPESGSAIPEPQPVVEPVAPMQTVPILVKTESDPVPISASNVAPIPSNESPGISREMIQDLIREEIGTPASVTGQPMQISDDRLEVIENKIKSLSSSIDQISENMKTTEERTLKTLKTKLSGMDSKRFDREIEKISDRVFDVMDEIGYGESLNVAKIPPNILEIVYSATLEDVVKEMNKALGDQEAERKINKALEDVRLRTSGSELFRFDGRRIVTENLARSLETHMISAKQIQTTYTELLKKLLETIPGYKAKNFQAMIKIKSQEYAVDKATVLSAGATRLESNMNNMGQMIAAFSSQLSARALQLEGDIKQNQEDIASKSDKADIESLLTNMMERAESDRSMRSNLEAMKEEIDAIRELSGTLSQKLEDYMSSGSKGPVKDKKAQKEKKVTEPEVEKKSSEGVISEPEKEPKVEKKKTIRDQILEAVSEGSTSKTAIKNKLKITDSVLSKELEALVKAKKILKKGSKNRPSYAMPEGYKKPEEPSDVIIKDKATKPKKEETKQKDDGKASDNKKSKTGEKEEPKNKKEKSPAKTDGEAAKGSKKKEEAEPKAAGKKKEKEKPKDDAEIEMTSIKPAEKQKATASVESTEVEKKPTPSSDKVEEVLPPSKTMKDLDDSEKKVLDAIPTSGITLANLKKTVAKDVKYTVVLRALRVLLDSGLAEATTQGRHTVYQKINVKKMDKTGKKKDKQEVK